MQLCLDVGNTNIFGGVFDNEKLILRFRHDSTISMTSDQLGIFLRAVLHENNIAIAKINKISIASVVPNLDYLLRSACIKYFKHEPYFLTYQNIKNKIVIATDAPHLLGADIIAGALAAIKAMPDENIIIVDFGTATTICAITLDKKILGGVILAGIKLSMLALSENTAKLFPVEIIKPKMVIGTSTEKSIQSGLYYGNIGMVNEFITRFSQEAFAHKQPKVIATGGFSILFKEEKIFDAILPDLVLDGVKIAADFVAAS